MRTTLHPAFVFPDNQPHIILKLEDVPPGKYEMHLRAVIEQETGNSSQGAYGIFMAAPGTIDNDINDGQPVDKQPLGTLRAINEARGAIMGQVDAFLNFTEVNNIQTYSGGSSNPADEPYNVISIDGQIQTYNDGDILFYGSYGSHNTNGVDNDKITIHIATLSLAPIGPSI